MQKSTGQRIFAVKEHIRRLELDLHLAKRRLRGLQATCRHVWGPEWLSLSTFHEDTDDLVRTCTECDTIKICGWLPPDDPRVLEAIVARTDWPFDVRQEAARKLGQTLPPDNEVPS